MYIVYFFACLFFFVAINAHTHTHIYTLWPLSVCACVCVQCADWASVLAIRKTTSGKVHINHVPQLKERNGAEMGGGGGGGGERIMRECV